MAELEDLVRQWNQAEGRLYPVVLVRPELYQRYVQIVRAVAEELRSSTTPEALAERFAAGEELVRQAAERLDVPTRDMDVGLVAAASFAHRYREVLQDTHRDAARDRIRVARERGEERVTVYQTGSLVHPPYRRLEMRLSDGAGIHSFVEIDPETGGPLFGLEEIQLDPQTGDWVTDAEALALRRTFGEREDWLTAVAEAGGTPP
jgi:hypothetical protein